LDIGDIRPEDGINFSLITPAKLFKPRDNILIKTNRNMSFFYRKKKFSITPEFFVSFRLDLCNRHASPDKPGPSISGQAKGAKKIFGF